MDKIAETIANSFFGPMLYDYVWFILEEAKKRNIYRLYFLARDGYLLRKIACEICKKNGLSIECKYLYVSRMSLRIPTLHFIGNEGLDVLFFGGYEITLELLLQRINLDSIHLSFPSWNNY